MRNVSQNARAVGGMDRTDTVYIVGYGIMCNQWAIVIEDQHGHKSESALVYGCWLSAYEHVPDDVLTWLKGHGFEVGFKSVKLR